MSMAHCIHSIRFHNTLTNTRMCVFIIITFAAERMCARSAYALKTCMLLLCTSSMECVCRTTTIYTFIIHLCIFPCRHVNRCICDGGGGARGLKCAESAKIPLFSNETHTEYYYYKIPTIKL